VGLELVGFWRVEGLDRKTGNRVQGIGNSKGPRLKPPAPSEGQGREFFRGVWEEGRSVVPRCALHSGLRQSGSAFGAAFIGVAKATPYQSGPHEIPPASKDARRGPRCAGPSGGWRLTQVSEVARKSDPTSQKRDVGHPICECATRPSSLPGWRESFSHVFHR
jgi:hypothetical protein